MKKWIMYIGFTAACLYLTSCSDSARLEAEREQARERLFTFTIITAIGGLLIGIGLGSRSRP